MNSAFVGADAVDACLSKPLQAARELKKFDHAMAHGPKVFSWFIYRLTTPSMRNLLMYQGPESKIRKALVSVLIGDVFALKRFSFWLFMFKVMYYLGTLADPKASFLAWRKRKRSIQVAEMGLTG